jgi:hypothetical protein
LAFQRPGNANREVTPTCDESNFFGRVHRGWFLGTIEQPLFLEMALRGISAIRIFCWRFGYL